MLKSHLPKLLKLVLLFTLALGTSTLYINCSGQGFAFLGGSARTNGISSGGGGIDGMRSYFSYGPCGGGPSQVNNIIVISNLSQTATMSRQNCIDLDKPLNVPTSELTFALNDQSTFTSDGKIYDLQVASPSQRITTAFCTAVNSGSPETLIWQNLNAIGTVFGSVKQSDGSSTGQLSLIPPPALVGNYQSAAGQPGGQLDLNLSTPSSGTLTYSIGASPPGLTQTVTCITQTPPKGPPAVAPMTNLHYSGNSNFDSTGQYTPGSAGFNIADVSSMAQLNGLPTGVKGLVWLGLCNGADTNFVNTLSPFIGNKNVFGFYLMDNPDPTGKQSPLCTPANLKAESDWIHLNIPGTKTFIVLMNMGSDTNPTYANTYSSLNTDIDLFGLNPYPCQAQYAGCNYSIIGASVAAAEISGISANQIIPVYQAFGGSGWILPSASQEKQILMSWALFVPTPAFEDAYSWGIQNLTSSLQNSPAVQAVFQAHNSAMP